MKKSPFLTVKEQFTDKKSLAKAVKALATSDLWLDRVNDDKGLEMVSNQKLLHLHSLLTEVKSQFGSRSKLIDEVLKLQNRDKDNDFRTRLEQFSTPKLWDTYKSVAKQQKKAATE